MEMKNKFTPVFSTLNDIARMKVTVMGLGLNGGGLASARFFARYGADVTVTDMKNEEILLPSIRKLSEDPELTNTRIRYTLGRHDLKDFETSDLVIKNPGVKLAGNEYLEAARAIETDISVFLRFTRAPILAVTGSKGKSSTASALYYGLREAGINAYLGGNITVSPLTFLEETTENTPVVLELSSWQLGDLRGRGVLKPRVAIITLIVPDHQNWYGSMEPYVADKKLIYADQDESCYTICNRDDGWGQVFASETRGQVFWYSKEPLTGGLCGAWLDEKGCGVMRIPNEPKGQHDSGSADTYRTETVLPVRLSVPGFHMKENVLNAAQAMVLMGVSPEKTADILSRFPGIEHRLEYFFRAGNTAFYNDSAATVPEAAAAALNSFDVPVFFICGGTDKQLDFTPLAERADKASALFLLEGSGTDKLIPLLDERKIKYIGPFKSLDDLVSNVKATLSNYKKIFWPDSDPDRVVVFSPGATSFGMFTNEFDRGRQFKEVVHRIFQSSAT